jgi:hypothetical protein
MMPSSLDGRFDKQPTADKAFRQPIPTIFPLMKLHVTGRYCGFHGNQRALELICDMHE